MAKVVVLPIKNHVKRAEAPKRRRRPGRERPASPASRPGPRLLPPARAGRRSSRRAAAGSP